MQVLVLDPLGMNDSSFEQPPADWTERGATAHPWNGEPTKGHFHRYPEMAAAGLWTTATDLALAAIELLKIINGRSSDFLSKDAVESMLSPQLKGQNKLTEEDYTGLGFFCEGQGRDAQFSHGGWDEGFIAEFRMYNNLGKGSVIMINSNQGYPLIEEVIRSIAHEYEWPEEDQINMSNQGVDLTRGYSGQFETESGVVFAITNDDNLLSLKLMEQPRLPIHPKSELEFYSEVTNTKITFEVNEHNVIVSIVVVQEGQIFRALKMY